MKHISFNKLMSRMFYYLIMEYCDAGTLAEYVSERKLSAKETEFFFKQINEGLKYLLYEKMIVHRDIKLDNILLMTSPESTEPYPYNLVVKIADYGFCRSINCGNEHGKVGTPVYLCPEIHNHSSPTITSDLYSVGVMLYRMVFGIFPHEMEEQHASCCCCCKGGNRLVCENMICFPGIEGVDEEKRELVIHLVSNLVQTESSRLDWKGYFKHPFFVC